MKRIFQVIALFSVALGAHAQNIVLKDGKTVVGTKMRRDGASIMTTVPIGTGFGEVGYAVVQIASIEFPDPPQFKEAASLIAANKPEQALSVIEPVLNYYRSFKDIKGSFWGDAAVLKVTLCAALKKDRDTEDLIREMLAVRDNPEVLAAATASQSLLLARIGKSKEAVAASKEIINQENGESGPLSIAYMANGEAHLALKEYLDAVFSFLHVPIFFPDQKMLMPAALLGSARCFAKLDANKELENALASLIQSYPSSSEAIAAKSEFAKVISQIQKNNQ